MLLQNQAPGAVFDICHKMLYTSQKGDDEFAEFDLFLYRTPLREAAVEI